jgi:hypothetical protein
MIESKSFMERFLSDLYATIDRCIEMKVPVGDGFEMRKPALMVYSIKTEHTEFILKSCQGIRDRYAVTHTKSVCLETVLYHYWIRYF